MDFTRAIFESLWYDVQQFGPLLLVAAVLAGVLGVVAAVRNDPTWWRDFPVGVFWGWLAGVTAAFCCALASAFIEERIRLTYGYHDWQTLQIFALILFGPICLASSYLVTAWYFRRQIRRRQQLRERGLPIPPFRWNALSLRTMLLIQLGLTLAIGGWFVFNRSWIEFHYRMKQHRAWQKTVHARFDGYGWHLDEPYQPLSLVNYGPMMGFSDDVLERLQPADQLRRLQIRSDQLTDTGLKTISQQAELESLWIESANVSDVGIAHLANLPKLNSLVLNCSRITTASLDELRKAKPKIDISDHRWPKP